MAGLVGVKTAVSEWMPCGSESMSRANPAVTGTGAPSAVVPSMNWIVPATPKGPTLARKITGMPSEVRLGNVFNVQVVALA